jgi:hypothetical protein
MATQSSEGEYELQMKVHQIWDKHFKINLTIIFLVSQIEISRKIAKKGDFGNVLDQFLH